MAERPSRSTLRVALLGPAAVEVDGEPVEVAGHRRRSLLALLALPAPRVVSAGVLVDALWAEETVDSAQQALHTQVSRLRRALGPAAARLERRPPGYLLALDPGELDVAVAHDLARQVADELPGRPAQAAELAARALALWRGPALEEFADVEPLAARAVTLAELHRQLEQQWLSARIELGDATVVRDAATLAAAEPLHEPATVLWIRALAVQGSTAEAMRVAAAFRRRLAEETGLDPSPRLAELEQRVASGAAGLVGALAAPAPLSIRRRVARPVGPLEGREHDRAELERLLGDYPLVTVTGPGGVGKTRLVLEVVAGLTEFGRYDAVVVRLAAVTDPRRVPEAIATTLGLRTEGTPTTTSVADGLAAQELLLVLDNAEHVAALCRELITELQQRAPRVRVLTTSRVSLHAPGEYVLRLQPLPVPSTELSVDRLRRQPSARVFLDYATRRHARFTLGEDDVRDLIEVIRRLDGLPLGLELAAGQVAAMPLAALRRRLDRALDVLAGERADDDARQRTLRATVDWSYRLLAEPERALLGVLALFPGGIDLRTIEDLGPAVNPDSDPLLVLGRLVDASLVVHDNCGRYTLLETVRQFVLDRLAAAGDRVAVEDLFLRWVDRAVAELADGLIGPDEPAADARLRAELDNLRVARDLGRRRGDLDLLIRITLAVDGPSTWRNLSELWAWAIELAAEPGLVGHREEARVLAAAAQAYWLQGDLDASRRLALRGLQLAGDHGPGASRCWAALATVDLFRADFETSLAGFRRAAEVNPQPADDLIVAALLAVYARQPEQVEPLLERAVAAMGDRPVVSSLSFAEYVRGEVAAALGRTDDAVTAYTRAVESARRAGATFVDGIASVGLASVLARRGDAAAAAEQFRRLLRYWTTTGNTTQLWTTLRNVAWLLADQGRLADAAALLAAADAADSASGVDAETAARTAELIQRAVPQPDALGPAGAVRLADSALADLAAPA